MASDHPISWREVHNAVSAYCAILVYRALLVYSAVLVYSAILVYSAVHFSTVYLTMQYMQTLQNLSKSRLQSFCTDAEILCR